MPLIIGTDENDSLIGTEDHDVIRGLLGRDYVFGGGGDDRLEGGDGDDLMIGGLGDDLLLGGEGDDSLGEIDGGANDQIFGEIGNDSLYYYGASGGVGVSLLDGGVGNDVIRHYHFAAGAAASSTLRGGEGSDRISTYGGGQIVIDAGADADLVEIIDYQTDYTIALGSGSDVLRIDSNQFFLPAGDNLVVSDFSPGDLGDSLSLTSYLAHQLTRQFNGLWNFADNPFAAGFLRLEQRGADTVIQVDRDAGLSGDGFEDFLTLSNVTASALTARNLGGYASNGAATPGVTVDGGAAADFISGTSGDDLLRGFGDGDGLFGGAGDDELLGGEGDNSLDGEIGDDVVRGGDGNDRLTDSIDGSDALYGEGGNDFLFADRQWYAAPNATLVLDGGEGRDEIDFLSGVLKHDAFLLGGGGDDNISAYLGRNVTIDAGDGDDFVDIDVGIGTALITLGAGKDTLSLSMYLAPVVGFTVTDFQAGDAGDQMYFIPILQRIVVGWQMGSNPFPQDFLRVARQGADAVLLYDVDGKGAASSFETLGRYIGVDTSALTAFNFGWDFGRVAIAGTAGADTLGGTAAGDELIGLAGDDFLSGGAGDDTLLGGSGSDLLDGGAGADAMAGGTGNDVYYIDNLGDVLSEFLGEGNDRVAAIISLSLAADSDIERLEAVNLTTTNAMDLTGSAIANVIYGNDGVNILRGEAGNDELRGFGGNDFLVGGTGADVMVGGAGHDTYYVDDMNDAIGELDGEGNDRIAASVSFVLSNGAEVEQLDAVNLNDPSALNFTGSDRDNRIKGSNGANILRGEGGSDELTGFGGDDFLVGGAGVDLMLGGTGNDTYYVDEFNDLVVELAGEGSFDRVAVASSVSNYGLDRQGNQAEIELFEMATRTDTTTVSLFGSGFANTIRGNDGVNLIDGLGGSDILTGYGGADTFRFTNEIGFSVDTITDFVSGTDKIQLINSVFGFGGGVAESAFVVGTSAQDANDRLIYNPATGQIFYDADGNGAGAQIHFATLQGAPALAYTDFIPI